MSRILRKISKSKWYDPSIYSWLEQGEFQADSLDDLRTHDNELSIWIIEDESALLRIITAMAANCDKVDKFDCAILEIEFLNKLNTKLVIHEGETPDKAANTSWHYNIVELSANKVLQIAELILKRAQKKRIQKKDVKRFIIDGVSQGYLDRSKLSQKIIEEIEAPPQSK